MGETRLLVQREALWVKVEVIADVEFPLLSSDEIYGGRLLAACPADPRRGWRTIGTTMTITIYQKPTCSTCRQVYAVLKESGVDVEAVDYYVDPIPAPKLKELLRKMKMSARDLLRTREAIYTELKLAERDLSDDQLVELMVQHPDLIQRPIVEKGSRAVLARPPERLKEIV